MCAHASHLIWQVLDAAAQRATSTSHKCWPQMLATSTSHSRRASDVKRDNEITKFYIVTVIVILHIMYILRFFLTYHSALDIDESIRTGVLSSFCAGMSIIIIGVR